MRNLRIVFSKAHLEKRCALFAYTLYYCAYACALAAMVLALTLVDKPAIHFWLNGCHTPFADLFWRCYTVLAEWPLYVLMLWPLIGIWRFASDDKRRMGWMVGAYTIAELGSAAVLQTIKHIWNMPRPLTYFTELAAQNGSDASCYDFNRIVVEGVHLHSWHSFPSGHTATFFVFFTMSFLLLMGQDRRLPSWLQVLLPFACLICALAGGYSRIYLSQHFLLDVCVGSLIGLTSATITYLALQKKFTVSTLSNEKDS